VGKACFKKALDGKPCRIETQIVHKNVSHIVQFMKIEIKKFFHFVWRDKTPENKSGLTDFLL